MKANKQSDANTIENDLAELLDLNKSLMEVRSVLHGTMSDEQKMKLTKLLNSTQSRIIEAVMKMI